MPASRPGPGACLSVTEQKKILDLVLSNKPRLDLQDEYKEAALSLACRYNKLTSVRKLISAGASVTVTDRWGDTPLHWAARCVDVVREIL